MNLSPLFWTLSLLAVSIGIFLALASRAKARLKKQYPPIGQMVDIGGYRLHMHVEMVALRQPSEIDRQKRSDISSVSALTLTRI
jgi:hypothetical protein